MMYFIRPLRQYRLGNKWYWLQSSKILLRGLAIQYIRPLAVLDTSIKLSLRSTSCSWRRREECHPYSSEVWSDAPILFGLVHNVNGEGLTNILFSESLAFGPDRCWADWIGRPYILLRYIRCCTAIIEARCPSKKISSCESKLLIFCDIWSSRRSCQVFLQVNFWITVEFSRRCACSLVHLGAWADYKERHVLCSLCRTTSRPDLYYLLCKDWYQGHVRWILEHLLRSDNHIYR